MNLKLYRVTLGIGSLVAYLQGENAPTEMDIRKKFGAIQVLKIEEVKEAGLVFLAKR